MKPSFFLEKSVFSGFEPVSGTWSVDAVSDDVDVYSVADDIADELSKQAGFRVAVELFRENGHAILDPVNHGQLLAVRK